MPAVGFKGQGPVVGHAVLRVYGISLIEVGEWSPDLLLVKRFMG